MALIDDIKADLRRFEGKRLKAYKDTAGKTSIGYGRNLDDVGISDQEAEYFLNNDCTDILLGAQAKFPWWGMMTYSAKRGLCNMIYEIGFDGFTKFKDMIAALTTTDYARARAAAMKSAWYKEVPERAQQVIDMLK